jgi:uncharacterized protein (UPF0333 family)
MTLEWIVVKAFIIRFRYVIMALAVLAFLGGAYIHFKHKYYKQGYDQCTFEYKEAQAAAINAANEKIKVLEKPHKKKVLDVQNKNDSGYGVGPITSDAINGL